jgi:fatty-acyl-CoA synthase
MELYQAPMPGDMIVGACNQWPDRVALIDGIDEFSYAELGSFISRTIQFLKSIGLKAGDPVALLTRNCCEGVAFFYATSVLGLRYTPLHPLGSEDDHAFILQDASIETLVADAPFSSRADSLKKSVACLQRVIRLRTPDQPDDLGRQIQSFADIPLECEARADSDAYLGYTGGTTGKPKGVRLSQQSFATLNRIALQEWEWPEDIRSLVATPISHAGMALLLPTHLRGGTVHLDEQFTPAGFLESVQRHRINVTFLVPTMIYTILDNELLDEIDISSLDLVLYGASPMSPARLHEAMERIGPVFGQIYGQTEAPMVLTYLTKADHRNAWRSGDSTRFASCGAACTGVMLTLLDENLNKVSEPGVVGEICARGPLVMNGYFERPDETAEAFSGNWLHTGDMAYRDGEGYYYIVDRSKDMIISGGFNVFPKEVEDVLSAHPGVSSAAVIGVPDEKWGEKVMAVVVPKPGQKLSFEELAALVKEQKGSIYAPKAIEFVDSIPVTGLGKPDKKTLREKYWQGSDRNV